MRKTLHRYNRPGDARYLTFSCFRRQDIQPSGKVHFRFWQRGGGYDRNIFTAKEAQEKLTYMHNNPVKRGLCATPSDWRWSSTSFYQGEDSGPVPVETAVI